MSHVRRSQVRDPKILKLEPTRDVIYEFMIGNAMAAYEHSFASRPEQCECGHRFSFADRLAAAILMGAHSKEEVWDIFKQGPKVKEYFEGALYCGECRKFVFATLNYEYPNHKEVPHDDFEREYIARFEKAMKPASADAGKRRRTTSK